MGLAARELFFFIGGDIFFEESPILVCAGREAIIGPK